MGSGGKWNHCALNCGFLPNAPREHWNRNASTGGKEAIYVCFATHSRIAKITTGIAAIAK
jgi:hypothetical protein